MKAVSAKLRVPYKSVEVEDMTRSGASMHLESGMSIAGNCGLAVSTSLCATQVVDECVPCALCALCVCDADFVQGTVGFTGRVDMLPNHGTSSAAAAVPGPSAGLGGGGGGRGGLLAAIAARGGGGGGPRKPKQAGLGGPGGRGGLLAAIAARGSQG